MKIWWKKFENCLKPRTQPVRIPIMTREADRLIKRYEREKNPGERTKIKTDLDQVPLSSGELEQVQVREVARKSKDIEEFHRKK